MWGRWFLFKTRSPTWKISIECKATYKCAELWRIMCGDSWARHHCAIIGSTLYLRVVLREFCKSGFPHSESRQTDLIWFMLMSTYTCAAILWGITWHLIASATLIPSEKQILDPHTKWRSFSLLWALKPSLRNSLSNLVILLEFYNLFFDVYLACFLGVF